MGASSGSARQVRDGVGVGSALGQHENGLVAELEDLYLAPHARRRGLGWQLVHDSAARARALGALRLTITIAPNGLGVSGECTSLTVIWPRFVR